MDRLTYHFYLIIYGGNALTTKFQHGVIYDEEDYEKIVTQINDEYWRLQTDLNQNPNRYMILNYNTGLYLGPEDMNAVKKKFSEAIIITRLDVTTLHIDFEKESQFVFKYLVSQWLRLNSLV